jgi:hypothetical protein
MPPLSLPWIMNFMEWKPINTVPLDRDVEIAIIDSKDVHVVAVHVASHTRGGSQPKVKSGFVGYALRTGEICRLNRSIVWQLYFSNLRNRFVSQASMIERAAISATRRVPTTVLSSGNSLSGR